MFLWDTSASVGADLPVIYNALMAYAEDLVPDRDAANLILFGGSVLLQDWYDDPYIMQTILNDYPRKENSSEAEKTLRTASEALAPRPGTKAIVMVTDAATGRYSPVWDELKRVQPRIFGLGVGSQGAFGRNPVLEQDLMQDWSRVNGGHYSIDDSSRLERYLRSLTYAMTDKRLLILEGDKIYSSYTPEQARKPITRKRRIPGTFAFPRAWGFARLMGGCRGSPGTRARRCGPPRR